MNNDLQIFIAGTLLVQLSAVFKVNVAYFTQGSRYKGVFGDNLEIFSTFLH